MSDLLNGGGLPAGWGYPNPFYIAGHTVTDGMIWQGKQRTTAADVEALENALGQEVEIDKKSLCGLYDWRWTTTFNVYTSLSGGTPSKMGGLGSQNYENQHAGESMGALFRKPGDDMWYINASGDMVFGVPEANAGCYHQKYMGDGYYDNVEGVEPNSYADAVLGQGEFYWDDARKLYDVR